MAILLPSCVEACVGLTGMHKDLPDTVFEQFKLTSRSVHYLHTHIL